MSDDMGGGEREERRTLTQSIKRTAANTVSLEVFWEYSEKDLTGFSLKQSTPKVFPAGRQSWN